MMEEQTFQELTIRMIEAILRRDNPPDDRSVIILEGMMLARDIRKAFRAGDEVKPTETEPVLVPLPVAPTHNEQLCIDTEVATVDTGLWLTTKQAAQLIGILDPCNLSRLCRQNKVPSTFFGTKRMILKTDAETYAASRPIRMTRGMFSPINTTTSSVPEIARILGVSNATVYKACVSGDIKSIRIGGRVLVTDTPEQIKKRLQR
jgi:excisionase family DNA binding protein